MTNRVKAERGEPALFVEVSAYAEPGACILWPYAQAGGDNPEGRYGKLWWNGKQSYAHVVACELRHGPKPTDDHESEHLCPTRLCCNGSHVAWALHAPNCQRRTEHGTQLIGERHNLVKLTEKIVRYIRKSKKTGRLLAEIYGVSPANISLIRSRRIWRHVV